MLRHGILSEGLVAYTLESSSSLMAFHKCFTIGVECHVPVEVSRHNHGDFRKRTPAERPGLLGKCVRESVSP